MKADTAQTARPTAPAAPTVTADKPVRLRVQTGTETEGQRLASLLLAKWQAPKLDAYTVRAEVTGLPGLGQVVKFSHRVEGGRWSHEFIPVGVTPAQHGLVGQLLVESARVTQYERQLDTLAQRLADIRDGKKKGDSSTVETLQDKRSALIVTLKGSRAKCASYRESLGLDAARYTQAVKGA